MTPMDTKDRCQTCGKPIRACWCFADTQPPNRRKVVQEAYLAGIDRAEAGHDGRLSSPVAQSEKSFRDLEPMEKLVAAAQEFVKHDGGPGSEDYDAAKIYHARRAMQSALGFRCPKCGETLPHLYDENCEGAPLPAPSTLTERTNCKHCGLRIYLDESNWNNLPPGDHWRHHGSNLRECYITFAEPGGKG